MKTLDCLEQLAEAPAGLYAVTFLNESEFPLGLWLSLGGARVQPCVIAKRLSEKLQCRVLSDSGALQRHPYEAIVWDKGVAILADDLETLVADGDGGRVKLLRPLTESELKRVLDSA